MEGLWLIVAIIWFVARLSRNKKAGKVLNKVEKTAGGVTVQELKSLAREALEPAESEEDEEPDMLGEAPVAVAEAAVPAARADWASMRHEADLDEGESRLDDEGCIGGSLEHGHEEGMPGAVSAAASTRVDAGASRPRLTAAEMRRAVIASEVLRAPLALRGRQRGRFAR